MNLNGDIPDVIDMKHGERLMEDDLKREMKEESWLQARFTMRSLRYSEPHAMEGENATVPCPSNIR